MHDSPGTAATQPTFSIVASHGFHLTGSGFEDIHERVTCITPVASAGSQDTGNSTIAYHPQTTIASMKLPEPNHPYAAGARLSAALLWWLLVLFFPLSILAATPLKVGVYDNNPLLFTDAGGRSAGLFPEILEHIADKEGLSLDYVPASWSQLLEMIRKNEIDLLPAIAYSEERAQWLNFSDETVLVNWAEVYSSENIRISSLLDLAGKRVAVKMNDIHLQALRQLLKQFGISCRLIETDEYQTIFEMLDAGYLDIGVVNRLYGDANKKVYRIRSTPIIFNPIELRFATPKGTHQDLLSRIDLLLRAYKDEPGSVYHQAMQHWLAFEKSAGFPHYLPYLIGGLAAGLLLLIASTLLLRHQVARQTSVLSKTNKHLREEMLKRQRTVQELKKYARVVEASNDAVALFDRDHNHLLVNGAYLSTFKAVRDDLRQRNLIEVIGRDFFENHLAQPINDSLTGAHRDIFASYAQPGQPLRHLNIHIGPYVVTENHILGYAMDIRDITQQVELENQLKQAQKMEAIGMLAGGVAHDLNNILSGLVSYPDMLLVNRAADDPMFRPLNIIKNSGERAAAIVSDLLTLARRGVEHAEPVNLNRIVTEFAGSPEYTSMLRSAHGVKVKLVLEEELLNVMGAPVHLSKCLMNLFTNALEAMPGGGLLTITTANRYLEADEVPQPEMRPGEYVVLTVADTGLGMDREKLGRIFEPFYTSKVMGRSGTGLGMTLVWSAVKDHSGHITVDSIPGAGTTFTLCFPATRKKAAATPAPDLSHYRGNGETVLVVDDVEEQRRFTAEMLTMLGYEVATAASGEEAVGMIRQRPYDILVLDMIMPGGLDGLATYRKILAIAPGQKAIIASGFAEAENVTTAQELGAGEFVRKPYTVLTLAVALQQELQRQR